ncbi:MAG: hypothetical protein HQK92_00440 [Nitrospirae bacterium]|nr:hypothetical protein [Nitrospirota bacterium]
MTRLDKELDFYESNLAEFLKHYKGKYALIKNEELINTFTTEEEAYSEGVKEFGNIPFLIKLITETEDVHRLPALTLGLIRVNT